MTYQLLDSFRALFEKRAYLHRASTAGDSVAVKMYEDLYDLKRSARFTHRVDTRLSVVNTQNKRQGIRARRGDGSLGEIVPNVDPFLDPAFVVARGPIATIEVGIEVKILMKAMIKQIDRVISDLNGQATHFRARGGKPICVGVVGVNWADHCTSYEGDRAYQTDGKKHKHPAAEAQEAENRLLQLAAPSYDEFLILRFKAFNEPPFAFSWVDEMKTARDYGAILARISQAYEAR